MSNISSGKVAALVGLTLAGGSAAVGLIGSGGNLGRWVRDDAIKSQGQIGKGNGFWDNHEVLTPFTDEEANQELPFSSGTTGYYIALFKNPGSSLGVVKDREPFELHVNRKGEIGDIIVQPNEFFDRSLPVDQIMNYSDPESPTSVHQNGIVNLDSNLPTNFTHTEGLRISLSGWSATIKAADKYAVCGELRQGPGAIPQPFVYTAAGTLHILASMPSADENRREPLSTTVLDVTSNADGIMKGISFSAVGAYRVNGKAAGALAWDHSGGTFLKLENCIVGAKLKDGFNIKSATAITEDGDIGVLVQTPDGLTRGVLKQRKLDPIF